jgi:hypothetical protein
MNIFPINVARIPELIGLSFVRWKRHYVSAEL